jgi:hypothetical protein
VLKVNRPFGGICRLHLQGRRISGARNQMKAVGKQWTRHYIAQDITLYFNIILHSMLRPLKRPLHFKFLSAKILHAFQSFLDACYKSHPSSEGYKLRCSSLRSFLRPSVPSTPLNPKILFSTLFSDTYIYILPPGCQSFTHMTPIVMENDHVSLAYQSPNYRITC